MKLTEKIVWDGLEDNCFMIVDEINLEGLKYGQIELKGVTFQIDIEKNECEKLGYHTAVLETKLNMLFDPRRA